LLIAPKRDWAKKLKENKMFENSYSKTGTISVKDLELVKIYLDECKKMMYKAMDAIDDLEGIYPEDFEIEQLKRVTTILDTVGLVGCIHSLI
jgi:hypothetical protein